MFKLGDIVEVIKPGYKDYGLAVGSRHRVTCIHDFNHSKFSYIGVVCTYPGKPDISSGKVTNWGVSLFRKVLPPKNYMRTA